METTYCSFSGHRELPPHQIPVLKALLLRKVTELAEEGCTGFLCGGALGFDTLAAEAVIAVRSRYPMLVLSLALPCPEQSARWSPADQQRYTAILEAADETILLSDHYTRYCMMQRNRFLVDHSRLLLCYLTRMQGGTAATVRYALQQRVPVVNLAMEENTTT